MRTAYGDESFVSDGDLGFYVVALVVVPSAHLATAREHMLSVSRKGRRVHLNETREPERAVLALHVARGPWEVQVVASRLVGVRQERARRRCLTALFVESGATERWVLESRGRSADRRDTELVEVLSATHSAPGARLSHAHPSDEPLLWAADVIAGTTSRQLLRNEPLTFSCLVLS